MSFEAIKGISDAEVQGKAKVAEAEAKARQMLVDADSAGKAALEAAKSRADIELKTSTARCLRKPTSCAARQN